MANQTGDRGFNTVRNSSVAKRERNRAMQKYTILGVIALATLAVRDLLLLRHGEAVKLKYYADRETADDLAARFTTRALLRIYHALGRAADSLEANGNVRLTLMQLAVDINA